MRALPVLAASALALSSVAGVAAAQDDRYDPPRPDVMGEGRAPPVAYQGPFLNWPGKGSPAPAARPASSSPSFAPPPSRPPSSAQNAPPPSAPPPSAPPPSAPPPCAPPPSAQAMTAPPPAPAQAASAPPPAVQANGSPQLGVRFYSLHRDFGLTPDPDPTPTDQPMVLVGPPTGPQTASGASDGGVSNDGDDAKAGQQGAASDGGGE